MPYRLAISLYVHTFTRMQGAIQKGKPTLVSLILSHYILFVNTNSKLFHHGLDNFLNTLGFLLFGLLAFIVSAHTLNLCLAVRRRHDFRLLFLRLHRNLRQLNFRQLYLNLATLSLILAVHIAQARTQCRHQTQTHNYRKYRPINYARYAHQHRQHHRRHHKHYIAHFPISHCFFSYIGIFCKSTLALSTILPHSPHHCQPPFSPSTFIYYHHIAPYLLNPNICHQTRIICIPIPINMYFIKIFLVSVGRGILYNSNIHHSQHLLVYLNIFLKCQG